MCLNGHKPKNLERMWGANGISHTVRKTSIELTGI